MKKKYDEIKPLDITPKIILNQDKYEELIEYKFRYLELKELLEKLNVLRRINEK